MKEIKKVGGINDTDALSQGKDKRLVEAEAARKELLDHNVNASTTLLEPLSRFEFLYLLASVALFIIPKSHKQ
eukprot:8511381-Ditylum_brightwellii.AAC.1